ncbi:TetR/AcrR family transcriptional regulator [Streptomyces sp. DH41]|uniref:TetR/AcrR family transcriptional regulator n=1 Tax=Streptomyces sp. DH41 TaxID=3040125 RepID=UPI0024418C14|nr:TetR/AcrR family transcriptional regulator [Streptomyces sp. DH41]MDG9724345.1 TetR/AcrR family transcriptional regulator [Streptomyces sp. DH41]
MTNQRKPRGPYRKSAERRERILQAAYEAIDEFGEKASLQDIADRVGVTQPALTYYFPTRDELLLSVLERRDMVGKAASVDAVAEANSSVAGTATTARHIIDHPGLAKLYVTLTAAATDPDSPAHSYFENRYRTLAAEITEDMVDQQRAGVIRADQPAAHLARAVLAILDGLQLQWMHDPTVDIVAIAETFTRMLAPSSDVKQEEETTD